MRPAGGQAAATADGRVAADGAVVQSGRASCRSTNSARRFQRSVNTPPPSPAELPLTVQLVSVGVPRIVVQAAAATVGGVAADRAVGQCGRAVECQCRRPIPCCGVAADGAIGQHIVGFRPAKLSVLLMPPPPPKLNLAVAAGGVVADGAVRQRGYPR